MYPSSWYGDDGLTYDGTAYGIDGITKLGYYYQFSSNNDKTATTKVKGDGTTILYVYMIAKRSR